MLVKSVLTVRNSSQSSGDKRKVSSRFIIHSMKCREATSGCVDLTETWTLVEYFSQIFEPIILCGLVRFSIANFFLFFIEMLLFTTPTAQETVYYLVGFALNLCFSESCLWTKFPINFIYNSTVCLYIVVVAPHALPGWRTQFIWQQRKVWAPLLCG